MLPRRTLLKAALATPLVTTGLVAATAGAASAAPTYAGYVMGYFTESPSGTANNYGLHLAVSTDGLNWTPLNQNNPVVTPTAGTLGLRDPFILRRQDGTFTVVATDLAGTDFTLPNQYIHVWDSVDLRSFTGYRRVKVHSLNTHSWAPEAFWDAARGQYGIVYSINNGTRGIFYVNYTTDFVTVSAPQVFFDPGFSVLDGTVFIDGGVNYLYYKNTSNGLLYGARSSTLNPNSFTTYTSGLLQGGGIEAPIVAKSLTANTWYLWGDSYSPVNGEFYAWQSTSLGANSWTVMSKSDYTQPLNSKHATISPITATEQSNLLARWGAPAWNRLKSKNYPDRFVRHANNVGRIDPYPFDPYLDAQWKLVPGLADSAGISFQSVNFPDRYLRHSNFAMVLAVSDGTAVFRADATFYRTAGLGDAAMASFRSYNYPDRYLRHSNFVLRIDPLSASSSTTDKQDATFQVGY